jgi:hypothetical protein
VLADFARGINVGSRHDSEQMNRVIEVNQLRFGTIIDRKSHSKRRDRPSNICGRGIHVGKVVIELSED